MKKEIENKYWKLPAMERIHYDSKLREINKKIPSITITKTFINLFLIFTIFVGVLFWLYDLFPFYLEYLKIILDRLPYALMITLLLDLFFFILGVIIADKQINKLNRRFKLK